MNIKANAGSISTFRPFARRGRNGVMKLDDSLEDLSWIPRPRITALRRLGVETARDLVTHYPRRHEDRRTFGGFPHEESETPICLYGEVVNTQLRRFGGWKKIFEATLQEDEANALSQPLVCRWFNLHYVQKMIATGQRLVIFGKPKLRGKRICIDHPEFEVIENDDDISIHFERITPIYPATEGLSQRVLRGLMFRVLEEFPDEELDVELPSSLHRSSHPAVIRQIHFPASDGELAAAREHLVLAEFFALQMTIAARRAETVTRSGSSHCTKRTLHDKFIAALPFALTDAQRRVLDEIRRDLTSPHPMNRLLQGDVGSGKTAVAVAAILLVVEAGFQAALMAPTQILAEQHYALLNHFLQPLNVRVSLRTGSRSDDSFLPLLDGDSPDVIVGTHALLYEGVSFNNLGLAVVDEQHKFGVAQRARLTSREPAPDVLVMTATPIPRTLTMTVYGDLDVSIIDEMPRGRGKVVTILRDAKKLDAVLTSVRRELDYGRQLFVIYPLIDESEKLDAKAATVEFETWRTRLAPFKCELLHGRIPGPEKQAVMDRFRRGETHALISTTVIEVGVDVPNATMMIVENAERFGLAQLHQLRGRIGRGEHDSFCILLTSDDSDETKAKLSVLEKTNDGFVVAEADWDLRGPGDLLGTAQSGLPALKLGNLKTDAALMQRARAIATLICENDPHLEQPENQRFRSLIVEKQGQGFAHVV